MNKQERIGVIVLILVASLAVLALGAAAVDAKGDKVWVCHAAGQVGTTKYVSILVPANEGGYPQGHFTEGGTPLAGHEDDYLGKCEEPTDVPSVVPTETPVEPTATEVDSTRTPTPTEKASATPTEGPSPTATTTPTVTPVPTDQPTGVVTVTITPGPTNTPDPRPTPTQPPSCTHCGEGKG